jgi:cell division inhibitor SepF
MAGIWRKTLIYLGLVEDDDLDEYAYDEYAQEDEEPPPQRSRRRSRSHGEREPRGEPRGEAVVRPVPTPAQPGRFHLVQPTSFNDAQEVGDRFRQGVSVLMNLSLADPDLSRRLIDFASGLAYGLGGAMQPVAERVFLITPAGVQVSAEERRRLLEERGLFNQA